MRPDFRRENKKPDNKIKEEFAIILDIISENSNSYRENKLIQAIGTKTYVLLELAPKPDVELNLGDKVYIGEGKRDEIQFIKRALFFDRLSSNAKSELLYSIIDIVNEREEEYIKFLNSAGPITIRQHALEMIPGVWKKHLKDLLELRETTTFQNYKDVTEKCPFLSDPAKAFAQRILDEIEGNTEHKFFTQR